MNYYDRVGRPITLMEWADLHQDPEYCKVATNTVSDRFLVSTIWLGLDHGFSFVFKDQPVLIFETMVFDLKSERPSNDLMMRRYSTEEEALLGHFAILEVVTTAEDIKQ